MRKALLCLVFILLVSESAIAVESVGAEKNQVVSVNQIEQKSLSNEVALLRSEKDLLISHYSGLTNVVYWSLSFASVFLILFLGMIGYFNIRRASQDKETLLAILRQSSAETKAGLESDFSTLKESHNLMEIELSRKLSDKATELESGLRAKTTSISESLDASIEKKIETATSALVERIEKGEGSVKQLREKLINLKFDIDLVETETQINHWAHIEKVPANELSSWFQRCKICSNKPGYEWAIGDALENIERLISSGVSISGLEKPEVIAVLDGLQKSFDHSVKKIKSLI